MFRQGGAIGLVDLASRQWQLLPGHSDLLTGLAYSADGRWLAAADWSGLVHLWDAATGQPGQVLASHTGPVGHQAFSADGQTLVTGGVNEDKSAMLWTVPEIIQAEPGTAPPREAFNVNPDDSLLDLALSPDGNTLAIATHDTGVTLRNLGSGQVRQFTAPQEKLLSIAFSPDGTRLAAGSLGETVQVWDVASGQPVANLVGPQIGVVANLIFTPNGRWLIAGGQQNRIYGWEIDTAEVAQQIEGRGVDLALNPAGTLLAFKKTLDDVVIGDIFAAREAIQVAGGRPLAFNADGRLLAVGSAEGVMTLWGVP
jgi:WD40 repeat protein